MPADFPAGFVWGTATSSYQVEGAVGEDGRGPSIWDTFCATPGKTLNGDDGSVASDHYHRYREDVALMRDIEVAAYRFSVAWPRVQPDGSGQFNRRGLDFYSQLIDELLRAEIRPVLTLYHWDLPQALQERGGWGARDTAYRFADYAAELARVLGDRVEVWMTVNEPWVAAFLGHASGVHAPGFADPALSLRAAHHLLLGHGLAARAVRQELSRAASISIALNLTHAAPFTQLPADLDAARRIDGLQNRLFLEPVLRGRYPSDVIADTASITDWAFVHEGDLEIINAPIDLLGVNYYKPDIVSAAGSTDDATSVRPGEDGHMTGAYSPWVGSDDVVFHPHPGPRTAMRWAIDASGLTEILLRLHRDYPEIPLMVTENGAAFEDVVDPHNAVHDSARIAFLRDHLVAAHEAIRAGVDLRGYFVWSLLDNFEWAYGYSQRFGIVHVDFDSQRRMLKDSALWYREVVRRNRVVAPEG